MRFKLLTASLALLITQTTLAATPVEPSTCPSVDAFKNTGVSTVEKNEDGLWVGFEWKNYYGTENEWSFMISNIKASFASEALSKANAVIADLEFWRGPFPISTDPNDPMWVCMYGAQGKLAAYAITPAMRPEISKLTKLLPRK